MTALSEGFSRSHVVMTGREKSKAPPCRQKRDKGGAPVADRSVRSTLLFPHLGLIHASSLHSLRGYFEDQAAAAGTVGAYCATEGGGAVVVSGGVAGYQAVGE